VPLRIFAFSPALGLDRLILSNTAALVVATKKGSCVMKKLFVWVISVAVLGAAFAASAAVPATSILNTVELKKAIASGSPADQSRLSAHFAALAEEYTADANRHSVMATAYVGNRNSGMATTMGSHCKQLSDLATKSAATLHELAGYYEHQAAGAPATSLPANAAAFHAGKGAPAPTHSDLTALAARATTTADHRALEEYFSTESKRFAAAADSDVMLARMARAATTRHTGSDPGVSFDRLAALERDAAKEARAAAVMHKDLAAIAK
jgi:hypothetical protein